VGDNLFAPEEPKMERTFYSWLPKQKTESSQGGKQEIGQEKERGGKESKRKRYM